MGKGHSKHGHCYVVNAHFNPLCQLEENGYHNGIETPLASHDSGLQMTPELSFTLSEDTKSNSVKDYATKCALEVYLPEVTDEASKNKLMDASPEKADEEKSEKEEKLRKTRVECIQNKDSEQQEFSFILHNYDCEKTRKDDVEKIVVQSLCDALKSSLKLPSSGTHTVKVHLTVLPDGNKEPLTQTQNFEQHNQTCDQPPCSDLFRGVSQVQDKLVHGSRSDCPSKKNVGFTPTMGSCLEKNSESNIKCCEHNCFPKCPSHLADPKRDASHSPCVKRNCGNSSPKQEGPNKWVDASELGQSRGILYGQFSPYVSDRRERRHRSRHQAYRDHCYGLDLLGSEALDAKTCHSKQNFCDPRYTNPAFCSHVKDKSNPCHSVNANPDFPDYRGHKRSNLYSHHKIQDPEIHSHILKCKLLRETKGNGTDLSFDLSDLNSKVDMEPNHHRRSKSYDMNESQGNCCMFNSPRFKHRDYITTHSHIPQSPSRHHKHRHREREKDKQRAMQQVASWLEKEDLGSSKQKQNEFSSESNFYNQNNEVVERHEYHHIHEHHHYYHYLDS